MKKVLALIFSALLTVVVLSACGNSSSAHKVAGYKMYSVNVKSIKEDKEYHEFTVTGTTDAPDGSKIYAAGTDTSYVQYGSNAASADVDSWAKVKDGKFKADVDPNSLYYGKITTGQKMSAYIFAIEGFNQGIDSSYQFTKSQMKSIKAFASVSTFSITDEIKDYLNNLYKNAKSAATGDDSSDSSDDESAPNPGDLSSYNTGITYDQLARNPDQYKKKKVTFTGEVAQVIDQDGVSELRLAVDGDYDNIILVDVSDKVLKGSRVLENDLVTVYGISDGITNYTSTTNQPISIPSMIGLALDDKGTAPDDYGD
ncbi:hypothetical protein RZ76_05520 [Apilactobacillus kunkeei]|uniref:hypothetical protein n=1 Tax=Apilactobacillus kunkeei TaxID=148814 RepID=UPI0006CE8E9A|nr:hypothetical protein [Apilactobacillus kunkeei]KPN83588.1 hypothetical protein RZ76_05520 [Apilactobacillus kunkeei]